MNDKPAPSAVLQAFLEGDDTALSNALDARDFEARLWQMLRQGFVRGDTTARKLAYEIAAVAADSP